VDLQDTLHCISELPDSIEAYVFEGALTLIQYYLGSTQPLSVDAAWVLTALLRKMSLRQITRGAQAACHALTSVTGSPIATIRDCNGWQREASLWREACHSLKGRPHVLTEQDYYLWQ
jgi:hypothetical protein